MAIRWATSSPLPVVSVERGQMIAAHDKALHLLAKGYKPTGQLAMMVRMVGYTFTGLYLLPGG
jgi:hypothetical protein